MVICETHSLHSELNNTFLTFFTVRVMHIKPSRTLSWKVQRNFPTEVERQSYIITHEDETLDLRNLEFRI